MIKYIAIDFPEDFTPPEEFEQDICCRCPMYEDEVEDYGSYCCLRSYENFRLTDKGKITDDCPIKNYFN